MQRTVTSVCLVAASIALAGAAAANGRFPRAERVLEDPNDASHLILGATFGMLVTTDAGKRWGYVCEASFAEAGLQTDPIIALAPDGAIVAGIYASVGRSAPDACDFHKTLGMSNYEAVPDFALAASVPGRAVAVLVSLFDDGSSQNQLYQSDDGCQSWSKLGPLLPNSIRTVATVEIAPSDAQRVYVSGLDADGKGVLLRSDDGGKTFAAFPVVTDVANEETPYIAAVDAKDPDAIYLRTDDWVYDPTEELANANDALLFSADGGAHLTELLREGGKLFGFAFSPDGTELLVGYGDPVEGGGGRLTDPDALGIYRAPKGSSDFEKRYAGAIGCLTWTAQGLYACTIESKTGFTLGLATSTDFDLATTSPFTSLLSLKDVTGPLDCPACSSGSICRNYWQSTCQSWDRTDCESLIPTTPDVCGGADDGGANATGGAEAGQAPQSSGGANANNDNEGGVATSPKSPVLHASGSGCSCRTAPQRHGVAYVWSAFVLALALTRRRARRSGQRDSSSKSSRASVWR